MFIPFELVGIVVLVYGRWRRDSDFSRNICCHPFVVGTSIGLIFYYWLEFRSGFMIWVMLLARA